MAMSWLASLLVNRFLNDKDKKEESENAAKYSNVERNPYYKSIPEDLRGPNDEGAPEMGTRDQFGNINTNETNQYGTGLYKQPSKEMWRWNPQLAHQISSANATYQGSPVLAEQNAREAVAQANALRQAAVTFRDDQNQRDYNDQGFGQWSALANRGINSARQLAAMTGGNVDVNSQRQMLDNLYNISNNLPQSGARLSAAQNQYGLDKFNQLNMLGAGEQAANVENAQLQNLLDTAVYTRSNGLPFLRARGEAQEAGLAYDINPRKYAAVAAQYGAQIPQNEIEQIQAEARLRDPALLGRNAQMGDALRGFTLQHGVTPAELARDPLVANLGTNGVATYQPNPLLGPSLQATRDAAMNSINPGDRAVTSAFSGAGVPKAPITLNSDGSFQQNRVPARTPAATGAQSFVSPAEALGNKPAVHPVNSALHNKFQSVINNYTKDLPPVDADKIRLRLNDAIMEEIVNYAQLTPESIGSSAFYESAKKTFDRAMKNPELAKRLNSIPEDVQVGILQEALRKAGLTR